MTSTDRTPPQNIDLEMCVLGGIMLDPQGAYPVVADILTRESFYLDGHGLLFEVMGELHAKGTPPDCDMVLDELRSRDMLHMVGGAAVVLAMLNSVPSAASVEYHAKKVQEKANFRALIRASTQTIEECYRQEQSYVQVIEEAERNIMGLSGVLDSENVYSASAAIMAYWGQFEKLRAKYLSGELKNGGIRGLPSGFCDLDRMVGGFRDSELIIVAARPSMGKTSFALNIAAKAGIHAKIPVLMFSAEMSVDQITTKLLSLNSACTYDGRLSGVRNTDIERGTVDEGWQWDTLGKSFNALNQAPIYICDEGNIQIQKLKSIARQYKSRYNIGMVIVDYLQLLHSDRYGDNRVQEVSDISSNLKALAKQLKLPVIALSQLSRNVEGRANRRPQMSDLRDSGAIEQDADVIMFLYRESYYDRKEAGGKPQYCQDVGCGGIVESGKCQKCGMLEYDSVECIVGKNRQGATGTLNMLWTPALGKFETSMHRGK